MQLAWRPLDVPEDAAELPPLLVKYTFGPSDYKVWLTDLTYLWMEALDRRSIIQRALNLDTTIDPSEGPEQLRLLLSSVERAIKQEEGTALELTQDGAEKELSLHLTTPLPASLKALQWSVNLKPAPQLMLTRELVVPLLNQQVVRLASEQYLLQSLREKDFVIAKLIGQLQSDGVDLNNVFPRAASSRSKAKPISRQAFSDSVKGLVEFDPVQWRKHLKDDGRRAIGLQELLSRAYSPISGEDIEPTTIPVNDNWWTSLSLINTRRKARASSLQNAAISDPEDDDDSATGPGFQRQSTSVKLNSKSPSPKQEDFGKQLQNRSKKASITVLNYGDSTTDESDKDSRSLDSRNSCLMADSSVVNDPTTDHHHSHKTPKLDSWDCRKSDLVDTEGQDNNAKSVRALQIHSDTSGSEESGTDVIRSRPHHKSSLNDNKGLSSTTSARPKAKLGRIGGRRDADTTTDSRESVTMDSPSLMSTMKDGLDANEKSSRHTALTNARSVRQSSMSTAPSVPSPQRETSQQRADRKREQLKRELEDKSKAGTKKKRRF